MSIFVKTGSDATTTAVRLARGFTGRTKIMRCGYHGWHDWCVDVKGGIPAKLYEDTAAIIITPLGHPLAAKIEEPAAGFLKTVRELADKYGSVLIYDEVRTGFRMSMGGAQKYYGIIPDLACFGKAMANGYAISAVCGKTEIMKTAEKEEIIHKVEDTLTIAVKEILWEVVPPLAENIIK